MAVPHGFRVESEVPARILLITNGPEFADFIREASDQVDTTCLPESTPATHTMDVGGCATQACRLVWRIFAGVRATVMTSSQPFAEYVVEMSAAELERLLTLAEIGSDQVRSSCFLAGVTSGATIVDVGCGALGALRELAFIAGSSGAVLGIDTSLEALARARHVLDSTGLGWVEVRKADMNSDGLIDDVCPPGPFELAFCRFVLMHQSDPARTLQNISRIVRPGGAIIAQENAFSVPADADVPAAAREGFKMLCEAVEARGGSPDAGRHFADYAAKAGLELVRQSGFCAYRAGVGPLSFVAATVRNSRQAIVALEKYSEEAIEATLAALDEAIGSGRYTAAPLPSFVCISAEMRVPR